MVVEVVRLLRKKEREVGFVVSYYEWYVFS